MRDIKTTVTELKDLVKEFCDERDWEQFHSPKDLAIGLITEASEFLEHFRFRSESEQKELLATSVGKENLADELADTLFCMLRFAQLYHIDLAAALERKLQKNQVKYPVHLCRGKNTKYTELDVGQRRDGAD